MFRLGEKQVLQVEKKVPMGVFLIDPDDPTPAQAPASEQTIQRGQSAQTSGQTYGQDNSRYGGRYAGEGARRYSSRSNFVPVHVLLPGSQVPEGTEPGDRLEVFLYRDSEDRLIATRKEPKLTLHQVGYLTVKEVGRIGAFMDWGLDKDLLLPFHEQPRERVQKGQECLVAVYIDKSGRLCATMNVYPYLHTDSPYHTGDEVDGTAYQTSEHFGTFVAVDDIYSALIPRKELVGEIPVGAKVHARVTGVKPDGKLDLSVRDRSYQQIEVDAQEILDRLEEYGGTLPYSDRTDPEQIRDEFHMSKNEFKRALGRLLRDGLIEIGENEISLTTQVDAAAPTQETDTL